MTTATLDTVTFTTADGETREAAMYADGSYSCPFCSGAVISPAGWDENEANNASIYSAQGEAYDVKLYPHWQRETWEARGCGNPACVSGMSAALLAETRERIAAREAESAWRTAQHEYIMASMRESRERESALWDEISAKAQTNGQCVSCLRASYWQSRPRLVRHRDASNCPQVRKYEH